MDITISYYQLLLIVTAISLDEGLETIDELTDYLDENEEMQFHVRSTSLKKNDRPARRP